MHSNHYYNKDLQEFARELRTESVSKAEKHLWKNFLSRRQCAEIRFLRQRPIDRFIVDFFAPEIKLIVEVDGSSHYHKPEYDAYRQKRLESLGYTFIRFPEGEVMQNFGDVMTQLLHAVYVLKSRKG